METDVLGDIFVKVYSEGRSTRRILDRGRKRAVYFLQSFCD